MRNASFIVLVIFIGLVGFAIGRMVRPAAPRSSRFEASQRSEPSPANAPKPAESSPPPKQEVVEPLDPGAGPTIPSAPAAPARPGVELRVVDSDGVLLPYARIETAQEVDELRRPVEPQQLWRSLSPRVVLPPHARYLHAYEFRFGYASEIVDLAAMPDASVIELRPRPSWRLFGTVSGLSPAEETTLYLAPATGPPELALDRYRENEHPHGRVELSADEPEYAFQGVEPGEYVLGLESASGDWIAVESVRIADFARQRHDLSVPRQLADDLVVITVEGPAGEIPEKIWVEFDPRFIDPTPQAVAAIDGRFEVSVAEVLLAAARREQPVDRIAIRVVGPGWGAVTVHAQPGPPWRAHARFDPPGSLSVEVPGADGASFRGRLALTVTPARDLNEAFSTWRHWSPVLENAPLPSTGQFEVGLLAEGEYDLQLLWQTKRRQRVLASSRVEVTSGASTTARLAIPELHTARIHFPKELHGETITAHRVDGPRRETVEYGSVSPDGRVELRGLAPGRYQVLAGLRQLMLDVDTDRTIDFVARDSGPVVVTLVYGSPHPAGIAGFEVGDRILDIAASPVTTIEQFWQLVLTSDPDDPLEVTIERDGMARTLVVPSRSAGGGDSFGLMVSLDASPIEREEPR